MKHIYFIRHAETEGNKKNMLMGCRLDSPLSEVGLSQAQVLREKIKDFPIECVYVSSNTRAQDTANLVFGDRFQHIIQDELREQDFGKMTGVLMSDIPEAANNLFFQDPYHFSHEEGESLADLQARIKNFMQEVIEKSPHSHIALVTHENVIKCALGYMKDLDQEVGAFKFHNCSVTNYIFNDSHYDAVFVNRVYQ